MSKYDIPLEQYEAGEDARERLKLEDGFGNVWYRCDRPGCTLEIVRPGKVQCECDASREDS